MGYRNSRTAGTKRETSSVHTKARMEKIAQDRTRETVILDTAGGQTFRVHENQSPKN